MFLSKVLSFAFLTTQAMALLATFEEANIDLNNYQSAKYTDFNLAGKRNVNALMPKSGTHYIRGTIPSGQIRDQTSNGTITLNAYTQYGHINTLYYGCYSPLSFGDGYYPCNFTLRATCYDKSNNLLVFGINQQYTRTDNVMDLVDVNAMYANYASQGYFNGNGSGARCLKYDLKVVQKDSGFPPAGFYVDSITYTVTQ